jgi:DNA polymerase I-like protein with 3'-5' exonuclease and polymerase domains
MIEDGKTLGPIQHSVWFHDEKPQPDSREPLQRDLGRADLLCAHNDKFDVTWLLEMEFVLPNEIWCTMIGEYIFSRGIRRPLSLKATAERRDVTRKKSDLVDELFASGVGFEKMPLDTVLEYAEADVVSCAEIYLAQIEDLKLEENIGLLPTFKLMNEMTWFLCEIERNGIAIDMDVLDEVRVQFETEHTAIQTELEKETIEVMGDTVTNLSSGQDMTRLIYGYEFKSDHNKKAFIKAFNIGLGPDGRPTYPPRMSDSEWVFHVKSNMQLAYRTIAERCDLCSGSGKQHKVTKKGDPYKRQPACKMCQGSGAVYRPTTKKAGLGLIPEGPADATANGFRADKMTIQRLLIQAERKNNTRAINFLTKYSRLNALNTYLNSFVKGIANHTRPSGLLHANFNQTTTATGRLSSSRPNFQNQPKGGKFPVRKAVVSRFEGGLLGEIDYSQLEFRVAGILSGDKQILDDVLSGKDIHTQTAMIINQCSADKVTKKLRSQAKSLTFSPLYGGMGMSEPPHVQEYFKTYFDIYSGLKDWHKKLMDGVIKDGLVRIPCGREFSFPNAVRFRNGRVSGATQIVNFPVQSHATGTIVPLACVRALRAFKMRNLRSKLILTVHDSIVIDIYPGELEQVKECAVWAMRDIENEIEERFGYKLPIPLDIEMEVGKNWMEMSEVSLN